MYWLGGSYFPSLKYLGYQKTNLPPLNMTSFMKFPVSSFQINYARDKSNPSQFQELFSPFSSIAVWAAVRFIFKKRSSFMVNNNSQPNLNHFPKASNELVYAFLPLISDPGLMFSLSSIVLGFLIRCPS